MKELYADKFLFDSKEEFRAFEECYASDPSGFYAEVQAMMEELLRRSPSTAAERLRHMWTGMNLMELCLYFDCVIGGFHTIVRHVIDGIHDLDLHDRAYRADPHDLTIVVQNARLKGTLLDLIKQSFYEGKYGDWHHAVPENPSASPFLEALTESDITNTERAVWYAYVSKRAGRKVSRPIADVHRALLLTDRLYGTGMESLLLKNTQEAAARKLAVFNRVCLDFVADRILAYYTCTTGNQKRNHLKELDTWYFETAAERLSRMDQFLAGIIGQA